MRLGLLASLILLAHPAAAQAPEDGLYLIAQDGRGRVASTADGERVVLGERQSFSTDGAWLRATDNSNESFLLWLYGPQDGLLRSTSVAEVVQELAELPPAPEYALVVSGTAYRGGGTPAISFSFVDEANTQAVAEFLDVEIAYRRHPGHRLRAAFEPHADSFVIGEPVIVSFELENIGNQALAIESRGRPPPPARPDDRFVFAATLGARTVPDRRGWMRRAGFIGIRRLEPGDSLSFDLDLSEVFAFDEPGHYVIHGSFSLIFYEPQAASVAAPILWQDYVTRRFTVDVAADAAAE